VLVAALASAACVRVDERDPFTADGQVIAMSGGDGGPANACFSCHGLEGEGDGVSTPRLAGLDAGYLQKQLADYAADLRHDPTMTPIAQQLDDDEQRAVAAWYAALPVYPRGASPAPPPAAWAGCVACHGLSGEGVGAANPAVAGQPAAYTLDQLRRWKRAERRNDPRNVMRDAVAGLDEAEMAAIAAWLETSPAARPPDSGAASASAAATAAARPAASRGARRPDR
jgi:cytochrome c553